MGARRDRGPVRVGSLLTEAVPALADRLLEEAIRREWRQTVGVDAARRSRPAALRRGTLEVGVDNSPWLQELCLRAAEIRAALRERHGSAVGDVRFVLAPVRDESPAVPPGSTTAAARRRLSAEEQRLVDAAAGRLADPGLAASVKRIVTKDLLARGRRRPAASMEQT